MRRRLITTYIVIIAVTIVVTVLFSWGNVNKHFRAQVEDESVIQAYLLKELLMNEMASETVDFQQFVSMYGEETGLRITIIDMDGNVLADSKSDAETMENHKYREEFKSALKGEPAASMRYSSTLGEYYIYYAVPIHAEVFDGALRTSVPVENIRNVIRTLMSSVALGLAIGTILSIVVAVFMTNHFMEPIDELTRAATRIASGEYDNKAYVRSEDQIGELADAFNTMTYNLRKKVYEVESKNAELEAILTSMDTGLAAIDEDYRIRLCNEPFRKMLRLDDDLVGKLFYEATRNPSIFHVIEKSIDEDEYITEEIRIFLDGTESIIRISSTPIKSSLVQSLPRGILLILEDITAFRKLENVRSDFVSNVTHELKTPLTSIKGFVDALRQGAMDDKELAGRFLDIIDIESERLAVLIEDILSLSEIEGMKIDRNTKDYEIGDIVREVQKILFVEAEKKNIVLRADIQKDLPIFRCNRDRIKQLLINLIDNGIKYTEQGSVTVMCKESKDRRYLIIEVEDTGIGIEERHLERLFERFYRVDKGRSRKQGGTGLGLSIVKHISELYGGSVQVKSQFGKGTLMRVRLPYQVKQGEK